MEHLPELRLTADLSHWVLVTERLPTHPLEREWMERVVKRVDHTHARVGYAEHPQIPHTSWVGYDKEVAWFNEWWQRIWDETKKAGKKTITLTPEIGPVPYTITNKDGSVAPHTLSHGHSHASAHVCVSQVGCEERH